MRRFYKTGILLLAVVLFLSGCVMRTVDELYALPKRPQADDDLQKVIDQAMVGLSYSTPLYGENRQMLQSADLDGDGVDEYIILARDNTTLSLKLLIIRKTAVGYVLTDTIVCYGTAFDFIEFANLDDRPGVEIVLGKQVGKGVVRSAAVYRLSDGAVDQLLEIAYTKILCYDLDADAQAELLVVHAGENDIYGKAYLYRYEDEQLRVSTQMPLTLAADSIDTIEAVCLDDGTWATMLTAKENGVPVMSVIRLHENTFSYVCEPTSVERLDGHYIYPTDLDSDGQIEIPKALEMKNDPEQYWLAWYGLDADGAQKLQMYTYYNCDDGWYMHIDRLWSNDFLVSRADGICAFTDTEGKAVMTIYALTGSTRVEQAKQLGGVELAKTDTTVYVAVIGPGAETFGITAQRVKQMFYPLEINTQKE